MTDLEIVREILAGRKDLFADLIDRYKGLVFGLIQTALRDGTGEAEDLAQEVFLKAYRALPQFRGEASFSTWLYRIALNQLKDRMRARRPETVELASIAERAAEDPGRTPEETVVSMEYRLLIQRSLAELPENYRQALYLYHYHDLSYAEIGARLGVPARTIETRLYRAKKMLRKYLAEREVTAGCATR